MDRMDSVDYRHGFLAGQAVAFEYTKEELTRLWNNYAYNAIFVEWLEAHAQSARNALDLMKKQRDEK